MENQTDGFSNFIILQNMYKYNIGQWNEDDKLILY